jgi:hypothetical protein
LLLLGDHFNVLINYGYSKENTGSTANHSHEVAEHDKSTHAESTGSSSNVNGSSKLLDHIFFSPSLNHELLLLQLLHDIAGGLSGNVNPDSGEEGARDDHKDAVE